MDGFLEPNPEARRWFAGWHELNQQGSVDRQGIWLWDPHGPPMVDDGLPGAAADGLRGDGLGLCVAPDDSRVWPDDGSPLRRLVPGARAVQLPAIHHADTPPCRAFRSSGPRRSLLRLTVRAALHAK